MQDNMQNTENVPVAAAPASTSTQKKSGNVAKILCVVFALVAVGLGVYLTLDKTVLKDSVAGGNGSSKDAKECVSAVEEGETSEIAAGGSGYVYEVWEGLFYVTPTGDVYYQPAKSFYAGGNTSTPFSVKDGSNIGTKGKYTLKYEDFISWYEFGDVNSEKVKTFDIEGYKMDLSNIVQVVDGQYGQQKVHTSVVFIDKDGNLSTMTSTNSIYDNGTTMKLNKNLEQNVRSVSQAAGADEAVTVIHYNDGSTKEADYKKLFGVE